MIIEMVFSDQVLTSGHPSLELNIWQYRVAPSDTCLRQLRCSVLGVVRILPHLRSRVLKFLRAELIALARNYQIAQTNRMPTHPRRIHPFLMLEMATVQMLIAYLETRDIRVLEATTVMLIAWLDTGDIRKLNKEGKVVRTELSMLTRASELVKSAFKFLRRSRS
jgi:hypothetical protein